jgi:cytochrome b involved in lipid metabolism
MTTKLTKILYLFLSGVFLITVLVLGIYGFFYLNNPNNFPSSSQSSTASTTSTSGSTNSNAGSNSTSKGPFSAAQASSHNSAASCWLTISGKVYDITNYLSSGSHRAGNAIILPYCGQDATNVFAAYHNQSAYSILSGYYIGNLK